MFNENFHLGVVADARRQLRNAEANLCIKKARPRTKKGCAGFTWAQFADWFNRFREELAKRFPDQLREGTEVMQMIDRAGDLCIFCRGKVR